MIKKSSPISEKEKNYPELKVAGYTRGLIEASRDPLFAINLVGKITDMNDASVKITGVSRKELLGSDFLIILQILKKQKKYI